MFTSAACYDIDTGWLDGEIVVLGPNGAPDFNALQKSFDRRAPNANIVYFVFDAPFFGGYNFRGVELRHRRQLLKALFEEKGTEHVRYSADFDADPASILSSACRMQLEGVIAKRADSLYTSAHSDAWLKLKCKQRQEFIVCGFTERSDNAAQVGSLLLGVNAPGGERLSAGSVGTGWDTAEATDLKRQLDKLSISKSPLTTGAAKPGRWSKRSAASER